jgi:hypothetical protein
MNATRDTGGAGRPDSRDELEAHDAAGRLRPEGARPWGVMAEFDDADALLAAAEAARAAGWTRLEAYSPFPVEGLDEAVGFAHTRVPLVTFLGGLVGGLGGFWMQWWSATRDYPVNVAGRPLNSWPMFIPVTFEMTVLLGALAAFVAVLVGNRLPDLWTPAYRARDFDLADRNRFFLALRADDPRFDADAATAWLQERHPVRVEELPA